MQKKSNRPAPVQSKTIQVDSKAIDKRWLYLFVAALAFLLYANTIKSDYTVDDGTLIKNNKYTTQGIHGLGKIFTRPYREGFWIRKEGLYRPLSVAMFAIEWQIAPGNPIIGHIVNVLLYALTAVVLLAVLRKLLHAHHPLISLIITCLFIAHPVHTEVVANIKSRDEILSLLFGLTSVYFLLRYADSDKIKWIAIAVFSYFLSLLSKENSVTWIGVFPLALWCATKLDLKKIVLYCLPFFIPIIIDFILRQKVIGTITGNFDLLLINNSLVGATNGMDRFATEMYMMGKYIWLLFFPVHLVFDYSFNTIPIVQITSMQALVPLLIIISLIVYALMKIKNRNLISFGILFYIGTLLLASNILILIEATMAERFLYTPLLGFCIAVTFFLSKWLKTSGKIKSILTVQDIRNNIKLIIPLAVVLILYSGKTISRNFDWKDNITLLGTDVKQVPNSARVQYAYGSALLIEKALNEKDKTLKDNYLDQAIEHLQKGVSILANYNDAWYHLGLAYKEKDDAKDAVAAFEQSRSYKTFADLEHLTSSGLAYGMAGQYDKAIADLELATHYDSTSADAYNNLGLYLSEGGQHEASLKAFEKAIQLNSKFAKAYYNRGNAWAKVNDFHKAIEDYKNALTFKPDYGDALNNIGNSYAAMLRPDSAKPWFEKAVIADPENMKAALNLGITLQMLGDSSGAKQYIERAKAAGLIH